MKQLLTAVSVLLLVASASSYALAIPAVTPEIPAGSAGSALALVSGMLFLIRARRK